MSCVPAYPRPIARAVPKTAIPILPGPDAPSFASSLEVGALDSSVAPVVDIGGTLTRT